VCEKNAVQNTLYHDTYSDSAALSLKINILTLCKIPICLVSPSAQVLQLTHPSKLILLVP